MAPGMSTYRVGEEKDEHEEEGSRYLKGVRHLCDSGITKVPRKYIFPLLDRPVLTHHASNNHCNEENNNNNISLPIIDFSQLHGPNRSQTILSLARACQEYGFFQLINHGIESEVIERTMDAFRRFFEELPYEERSKYMSSNMFTPVRYGTSFNQNNDGVFCWRDFLKLSCHPLSEVLPFWPSSPSDLRQLGVRYSQQTKSLYMLLMEAILESLGINNWDEEEEEEEEEESIVRSSEEEEGNQIMMVNYYPPCPEPDVTLGMPPHSDFGLLTLLLQDGAVNGLQIQHAGTWLSVEPILPNSFLVNIGDHLEILSNGRFKSVLHRVLVNPWRSRLSIASLHSPPYSAIVRPSPELINESNPRLYMDTDFPTFLRYISSTEATNKSFLDSRKLTSMN